MRAKTALMRRENRIGKAIRAVKNGVSYRQAEKIYRVARSTTWDRIHSSGADHKTGKTVHD